MSDNDSVSTASQPPQETCPECGGLISTIGNERACEECGLVLEDTPLDHGPEWHHFDAESRRRTGPPRSQARHDNGLGSEIGYGGSSNASSAAEARQRRAHSRAKTDGSRDRTERDAQIVIRRLCGQLDLSPSIVEQAGLLWKTIQKQDLHDGRSYEVVAAACVYSVCRINSYQRSLEDVTSYVAVPENKVESMFWTMNDELELPIPIRKPVEYVPKIVSAVDVETGVQAQAHDIARRTEDCQDLIGRSPNGLAAAAVWIAALDQESSVEQQAIADAADTSRETVRAVVNRLKALEIAPAFT